MGRKWITIEIFDQATTHIAPRLTRIINGEDETGVSSEEDWKGGGGFRYFNLAPSLIETDRFGMSIISKEYNAARYCQVVCGRKKSFGGGRVTRPFRLYNRSRD
jgi:adenine-specific DNA-methyltransferase